MMTNLRLVLAFNMKEKRRIAALTQAELAEKVNAATNYISMIESGKKFPSIGMIEKIAHALAIDPLELFSIKPPHKKLVVEYRDSLIEDVASIITQKMNNLENEL
jgi:transcriptional regulator with XRE-family HTH domain